MGPRVEVKGLQSTVKNCCQQFGRSNTAKVVEGVRRSAAPKQHQETQQNQEQNSTNNNPEEGVPRRVPASRRVGPKPRKGGGPEGWGARKVGGRRVGGPKFRAFFLLPPFSFFFSLSGCLLVSFFLSGCLLVEFWWCFGRSGPPMCLFSPSGCPVKPRRPAGSSSKTWQKQHKKATKAVQTLWKVKSGKGVFSHNNSSKEARMRGAQKPKN